ncbi:tetratricopeptide repeat protein [Candidatus Peregrinibacteria bacterium]|nr:tetratricopeptide repeat protein [Candidatus Peregrinibacteria bacterium]
MWTYLVIFLSITALLIVFLRRLIITFSSSRKKDSNKEHEENTAKDKTKKVRLSHDDRKKVNDLCKRGQVLVNAGKEDEAIKCFVQALSLDPTHKETMHNLAVLYMHKEMFSPAAALFKELAQIDEDSVHYSHLGLALYNQNDYEGAREAYQKSIDLDPSRPQRFVSLCQVYRSMQEPDLAMIALNKALDMDEKNIDYMFLKLDLLNEFEDTENSKEVVGLILKLDPENKEAQSMKRKLQRLDKAKNSK